MPLRRRRVRSGNSAKKLFYRDGRKGRKRAENPKLFFLAFFASFAVEYGLAEC
jgi:hypothetical protein